MSSSQVAIGIDAVWLAVAPLDMRAGTESALARVVNVFGAAHPHHAYLFANRRSNRMKVLVPDGTRRMAGQASQTQSMAFPAIEFDTPRLAFRAWQDRHRAPFAAMNADPEVMRYFPALLSAGQTNAGVDIWCQQFAEKGWSNWAVELQDTGEFIGFIGLSVPRRQLPFSPCVEIGWRLKRSAWGQGYATEGAKECLRVGFDQLGLDEIVSFTALTNLPSIAVMKRIGMTNAHADFEHPAVPEGSSLRLHCLYKITRAQWRRGEA